MANLFEQVNIDAIQLAGRTPDWLMPQADAAYPNGLPDDNSGTTTNDSLTTQIRVGARESVRLRTGYVAIRILDIAGTYRILVDANIVNFDATTLPGTPTRAEIITGWAAAINADVTVGPIVLATPVALQSTAAGAAVDTIQLTGKTSADYTIGVPDPQPAGSQEIDVVADVSDVDFRILMTPKNRIGAGDQRGMPVTDATAKAPSTSGSPGGFPSDLVKFPMSDWDVPNGAVYTTAGSAGYAEVFSTAGSAKVYVQVTAITTPADVVASPHTLSYMPRIAIGPTKGP